MSPEKQNYLKNDDDKFAFKKGGNNDLTSYPLKGHVQEEVVSPGKILYYESSKQKDIEAQKQKRKNELLDILGSNATHADILYGTEESLTKRAKELNLLPFSQDKDKHETLRKLSVYAYDNGRQELPEGYRRLEHNRGKNNGFDSVAVANDDKKEVVIGYRGMELLEDLPSVSRIKFRNYTSQQKDAQAVYDKIKNDPKYKDYDIYTTGTSLGGYLAQYVAGKNDLKSATFNTYKGTKKGLQEEANKTSQNIKIHPENIVNYRNKEDVLSRGSLANNIGLTLETDTKINRKAGLLEKYHIAENMGNLENGRKVKEDYSKEIKAKTRPIDKLFANTVNFIHDKLNPKLKHTK